MKIEVQHPYDWESTLAFFARRAITEVELVADGAYSRAFEIDGEQGWFRVHWDDGLIVETTNDRVIPHVRRMFDADVDPSMIAEYLSRDTWLAPLIRQRPGLRVPKGWNAFEVTMRAIYGQQVTVRAGVQAVSALASAAGDELRIDGAPTGLTRVFPRPSQVNADCVACVRGPRARAETVLAVARLADGRPEFTGDELRTIKGVGDWTVGYVAMRGFGDRDAFPSKDVVLLKALARQAVDASPRALLERAENWRPFRAYAALHLWASES